MTPETFPKIYATAFATQDTATIVALLSEDAQMVTLSGAMADSAAEARVLLEQEFAGLFRSAKLVTGKIRLRPLGPGGAILHQRFVVIGASDPNGAELPRFGAVLTAVLLARSDGWRAVSLTFSPLVQ